MGELALLIIFLLIIAILVQADFIFYVIYVTIGIFLWSHWYTPHVIKLLSVTRDYRDHAFLGEQVTITLTITNRSRLPILWLQIIESIAVQLRAGSDPRAVLSLKGRKSRSYTYQVKASHRGYYRLGPTLVTTGDMFGFNEKRFQLPEAYLTVYPKIIRLTGFRPAAKIPFGTVSSNQPLYADPTRPIGMRNYYAGDSLRHINWKASAHNGNLLIKTFQPVISLESYLVLDLNKSNYSPRNKVDGPEWSISLAASFANYLIEQRQIIGLATNGLDPIIPIYDDQENQEHFDEATGRLVMAAGNGGPGAPGQQTSNLMPSLTILPNQGRGQLIKILEILARIETSELPVTGEWILNICSNLNWGVTILVLSPSIDDSLFNSLHTLVRSGYNPIFIMTDPYANFQLVQIRAHYLGFKAFHLGNQEALSSWKNSFDRSHYPVRK